MGKRVRKCIVRAAPGRGPRSQQCREERRGCSRVGVCDPFLQRDRLLPRPRAVRHLVRVQPVLLLVLVPHRNIPELDRRAAGHLLEPCGPAAHAPGGVSGLQALSAPTGAGAASAVAVARRGGWWCYPVAASRAQEGRGVHAGSAHRFAAGVGCALPQRSPPVAPTHPSTHRFSVRVFDTSLAVAREGHAAARAHPTVRRVGLGCGAAAGDTLHAPSDGASRSIGPAAAAAIPATKTSALDILSAVSMLRQRI